MRYRAGGRSPCLTPLGPASMTRASRIGPRAGSSLKRWASRRWSTKPALSRRSTQPDRDRLADAVREPDGRPLARMLRPYTWTQSASPPAPGTATCGWPAEWT